MPFAATGLRGVIDKMVLTGSKEFNSNKHEVLFQTSFLVLAASNPFVFAGEALVSTCSWKEFFLTIGKELCTVPDTIYVRATVLSKPCAHSDNT